MIEVMIYAIVILSLSMLARNIIAYLRPKIKQNIGVNSVLVGDKGELILATRNKEPLKCKSYCIELPYDTLISSGSLSSLSRKLSSISTFNPKLATFVINVFIPINEKNLYTQIRKAVDYQEFFRGHVDEDLVMLLERIKNKPFIVKYLLVICADNLVEIDRHKEIIELEINNTINKDQVFISLKEVGFRSGNLVVDILSQEVPIKKNKIYDGFSTLLIPSLPSRERHICIGETPEGAPYCMEWPRDFERHVGIIGPTGSGKSSLLSTIVKQLVDKEIKVYIVDPKGDLIEYLDAVSNSSYVTITNTLTTSIHHLLNDGGNGEERVLVIDEAWRVLGSLSGNEYSKVSGLFRESRSRGLRIIYATQNPWDLSPTIYNNTGTLIIFFNKNITYVRGVSEITGLGFDVLSGFITTRTPFNSIVLRNGYTVPDQVRVFTPHGKRGVNNKL